MEYDQLITNGEGRTFSFFEMFCPCEYKRHMKLIFSTPLYFLSIRLLMRHPIRWELERRFVIFWKLCTDGMETSVFVFFIVFLVYSQVEPYNTISGQFCFSHS